MCQFQSGLQCTSLQRHLPLSHSLDQSRTNLHVCCVSYIIHILKTILALTHAHAHTHTEHNTAHIDTLTYVEVIRKVVLVDLLAAKARRVTCSIANLLRLIVRGFVAGSATVRVYLDRLNEGIAAHTLSRGARFANNTLITSVSLVTITTSRTAGTRITSKSLQRGVQ